MTGTTSTIVFLLVRHVLRPVGLGPTPDDKDVEMAVLRPSWRCCTTRLPAPASHDRWPDPGHAVQALGSGALVGVPGHAGGGRRERPQPGGPPKRWPRLARRAVQPATSPVEGRLVARRPG